MPERLCPECEDLGYCLFREVAEGIAGNPDLFAIVKHDLVATHRVNARARRCPNLNDIDPYYPGKEKL